MQITTSAGIIELVNEPTYSFISPDNIRNYPFSMDLSGEYRASSIHGVLLNGKPIAVLGSCGGATGIHAHSCVIVEELLYLAVGGSIICISISPFEFKWSLQADDATCFGVYFHKSHNALISHGELLISRISTTGNILWQAGGKDIFTGNFELLPEFIEVFDFNKERYRFEYVAGEICA